MSSSRPIVRAGRAPVVALVTALALVGITQAPAAAAAPVAEDATVSVEVDTPRTMWLADYAQDADSDELTFAVVAPPAHGDLDDCSAGSCSYTPDAGYVGDDSFTWKANDGTADSNVATMSITVADTTPGNTITSAGPLTKIRITPDLNCAVNHAADSAGEFYGDTACGTFAVVDGVLYSPAQVPAGDPGTGFTPVSQTAVTGAGTAGNPYKLVTTVALGATGVQIVETDTYVVGQESYRTDVEIKNSATPRTVRLYRAGDCYLADSDNGLGAVGPGGAVSCVSAGSSRIEQFLPLSSGSHYYEAGFGEVWSLIASLAAFPDTCRCDEQIDNGAGLQWDVPLAANASATRSNLITFSPVGSVPLNTTKTVNTPSAAAGGTVTYTITVANPGAAPAALTAISDTLPTGFAYQSGSSTGATTSNPVNNAGTLTWALNASVPAGGTVTLGFSVTVSGTPGTYFNNATATATDLFVNPTGDTAPVTVTPVQANTAPDAVGDSLTTAEDTASAAKAVLANDTDADGDTLTVTGKTDGAHGTVSCTTTTGTYTPAANYDGPDSFTYTISDGHGGSDTATVTVTVTAVNDAPDAVADVLTTAEDTASAAKAVLANDTDVDGDTLAVTGKTDGAHGTVSCTTTTCTYTPAANYNGPDSFTYTISDGHGGSDTATVTVTVTAINDAPNAVDDVTSTERDEVKVVNVLANDTDVDGHSLTVTTAAPEAAHGTVACSSTQCTYTPAAGYEGPDSFTYAISDGHGGTDTATVSLTVDAVVDADVSIQKAAVASIAVGNRTAWTLVVTNESATATALGVQVTDTLPAGFKVASDDSTLCSTAGSLFSCNFGDLPPGGTRTVAISGAFVAAGTISNTATVSATNDGDPADNSATAAVQVTGATCTIIGTFGNDSLLGTNDADVICGLSGNDRINAKRGNDVVYGNEGNDFIIGLNGNDLINGGAGTDRTIYSALLQAVKVDLGLHKATGQGTDTLISIEQVTGSQRADVLTGNGGANALYGLGGDDRLVGGPGNDRLDGGAGRDRILGGGGRDALIGGIGVDSCDGGAGVDSEASC